MRTYFFKSRFIIFLILFHFIFLKAQDATVDVTEISKSLYKLKVTTNFSVNIIAFTSPDGIFLFDTGMPGAENAIKKTLHKLSDKEIKYIINSHFHIGHFGGNASLGENAVIISHTNMRWNLTSGLNILQEYQSDVLAQITFSDSLSLYFNGQTIRLYAVSGFHSDSDIIAYFPGQEIVLLGGILTKNTFPFIGRQDGGSIFNYGHVLDFLLNKFDRDTKFICGHGDDCTIEDITHYKQMMELTINKVKTGLTAGQSVEEMQKNDILRDWNSWGNGFVKKDMWIQSIADALNPSTQEPSKEAVAIPVFKEYKKNGMDAAIHLYKQLKAEKTGTYDFGENVLNIFGYSLMNKKNYIDAVKILKLNAENYPESANVYDSLGEAYEKSGDVNKAKENYLRAVENGQKNKDPNLPVYQVNLDRISAK